MLERVVFQAVAYVRLILAPSAIDAASCSEKPIHLCRSAVVNRQVSRLYGIFARGALEKIEGFNSVTKELQIVLDKIPVPD